MFGGCETPTDKFLMFTAPPIHVAPIPPLPHFIHVIYVQFLHKDSEDHGMSKYMYYFPLYME